MIRIISLFLSLIFSISAATDLYNDVSDFSNSKVNQSLMATQQLVDTLPCQEDCDTGQPHHCVGCFHAFFINNKPSDFGFAHQAKIQSIQESFLYKSPCLDSLKRPPLAV